MDSAIEYNSDSTPGIISVPVSLISGAPATLPFVLPKGSWVVKWTISAADPAPQFNQSDGVDFKDTIANVDGISVGDPQQPDGQTWQFNINNSGIQAFLTYHINLVVNGVVVHHDPTIVVSPDPIDGSA
jgi:hypothetical protein